MTQRLQIQDTLRRAIPQVQGGKDYQDQERLLVRVDRVLPVSGVEREFVRLSLEALEARGEVTVNRAQRHAMHSERAIRCTVLKHLLGIDYREMSVRLAQCELFRWFCHLPSFEKVRVPGKSRLQTYGTRLEHGAMESVLGKLREALADEERALEMGLTTELDLSTVWIDSTCLQANIHFPTDWVLLRDAVRRLVKAMVVIRKHGLKLRMPEPESFLAKINAQAMALSAAGRRKPGGKKARKRVLRMMKPLVGTVRQHGERYRAGLDQRWQETDWTRREAEVVLRRMENILGPLPSAVRQAHERISGERKVSNGEKIWSLYEGDLQVIVRGKAGAEVEFGNSLFVAETSSGLILHHELLRETSPGDAAWLRSRLEVLQQASGGLLTRICGDRGFQSAGVSQRLDDEGLVDETCPRRPAELKSRMEKDKAFVRAQKRRAQTEGRIGILKNVFLQGTPRAKGFGNRPLQVDWAVLAHKLWIAVRVPWIEDDPLVLAS